MEKIPENYIKLFEIAKTDLVKARRIGMQIPREKLDPIALLKIHEWRDKNTMVLSKELAMRVLMSKLIPGELFEYLEAAEMHVVLLATNLIRKISIDNFDYQDLCIRYSSTCLEVRGIAMEIALKMPRKKLSYGILRTFASDENIYIAAIARILLMKNFPEDLNYVDYIKFQTSPLEEVRNTARALALATSPELLFPSALIGFQSHPNHCVTSLSNDLADLIPTSKLDLNDLFRLMHTFDENIAKLVWKLAMKVEESKVFYSKCLKLQRSDYSNVRILSRALVLKVIGERFDFDVLVSSTWSKIKDERDLAILLLLLHFPNQVSLAKLDIYLGSDDKDVARLADELKREYYNNHAQNHEDILCEREFVTLNFN